MAASSSRPSGCTIIHSWARIAPSPPALSCMLLSSLLTSSRLQLAARPLLTERMAGREKLFGTRKCQCAPALPPGWHRSNSISCKRSRQSRARNTVATCDAQKARPLTASNHAAFDSEAEAFGTVLLLACQHDSSLRATWLLARGQGRCASKLCSLASLPSLFTPRRCPSLLKESPAKICHPHSQRYWRKCSVLASAS